VPRGLSGLFSEETSQISSGVSHRVRRRLAVYGGRRVDGNGLPRFGSLSLIEIVWKQAKYHWRNFVTWMKETIDDEVRNLLGAYGTKFQVNFA